MAETIASYWYVIVILLAGVVAAWLTLPGPVRPAPKELPKKEPAAPQAVADLAREMPKATEPVDLVDGAPAPKPVAKEPVASKAASAATKPKVAAKPKAEPAAKPKVAVVPKAKPTVATAKAAAPAIPPATTDLPKAKAAPKAKPAAVKAAPQPVIPDNLELLKGVGPKLNTLLKSLGVSSFAQIAGWSAADIDEIDAKLGVFAGRIRRDNWVDQAKLLVAGDVKAFEKKYGALGSEVSR